MAPAATPAHAATRLASFDAKLLELVNKARSNAGVSPVRGHAGLTDLSVWWSNQMATGKTGQKLQHNPNAWGQLPSYGAASRTTWGETVAKFHPDTAASLVFQAYMNSPGHKAIILSASYKYVGVGSVAGSSGFNTMTFTDKVDDPSKTVKAVAPTPKAKLTAALANSPVASGKRTTVKGTLKSSSGKAIKNAGVVLYRKTAVKGWSKVASGKTSAKGAYSFAVRAGATGVDYQVRYAGSSTAGAANSPAARLVVAAPITLTAVTTRVKAGKQATWSVRTASSVAGKKVYVQRSQNGKWVTIAHAKVKANGTATLKFKVSKPGAMKYRVVLPKTGDKYLGRGESVVKTVRGVA